MTAQLSRAIEHRFLSTALYGNEEAVSAALGEIQPAAKGYEALMNKSARDLAAFSIQSFGGDPWSLSDEDVAIGAMFGRTGSYEGRASLSGYSVHDGGSFPYLFENAMNKVLAATYKETPSTWQLLAAIGEDFPDFKERRVVNLSEVPDLTTWEENKPADEAELTDERVKYSVGMYARAASLSWRAIINDDLGALASIGGQMGRASKRSLDKFFYNIVASPNVHAPDSVAFYSAATGNRKFANLTSGAISQTTLGTVRQMFRLMPGQNTAGGNKSDAIIDVEMKYLVVPAELEGVARTETFDRTSSSTRPDGDPNQFSSVIAIVAPHLSAKSATAWYAFGDPMMMPAFTVAFLRGYKKPKMSSNEDWETKSLKLRIEQSWGCVANNPRGVIKSTG